MAINTGDVLMGLGAAIGGTGPQFIQGLQQREQQLTERKRAEIEARQKAMYQDAATGLQLLAQGDLDGLIALGEDRLQLLQTYPDADPSDTQRIVQNARLAKQGDPVALRNLATELSSATSRGLAMGLVKLPEAQKPVVVDNALVDPTTGKVIYQGEEKPQTPLTDIGKLNRALATGEITQAQYDEAMLATKEKPEEIKTYQEASDLRKEFSAIPVVRDFAQQSTAFGRIEASAINPSPAGDMSLIFNFMKVLDPGSTVREGEYANAQNAGSIPDNVRSLYNKAIEGTILTDEKRADFVGRAKNLYNSAESGFMRTYNQYKKIAERRKLPIEDSLIDFRYAPTNKDATQAPQSWIDLGLTQDEWNSASEDERKPYLEDK
jgi:hypothetical protein